MAQLFSFFFKQVYVFHYYLHVSVILLGQDSTTATATLDLIVHFVMKYLPLTLE